MIVFQTQKGYFIPTGIIAGRDKCRPWQALDVFAGGEIRLQNAATACIADITIPYKGRSDGTFGVCQGFDPMFTAAKAVVG